MLYDVTYLLGGEERIERVDAQSAAAAAATVQDHHGRTATMFELIQVHLLEEQSDEYAIDQSVADPANAVGAVGA